MRRFAARLMGRLRRPAVRVLVARIIFCLTGPLFLHRPVLPQFPSVLTSARCYFL